MGKKDRTLEWNPKAMWPVVVAGLVLACLAFLRGNYLLGFGYGVTCALISVALLWLFVRSFQSVQRASHIRAIAIGVLSLPIGYILAFPASINSDMQYLIEDQATDRAVRRELNDVLRSDPALDGLWVWTTHRKAVNVEIYGSLSSRADLNRLRDRLWKECPTLNRCVLHWTVEFHDGSEDVHGLDMDVFPSQNT